MIYMSKKYIHISDFVETRNHPHHHSMNFETPPAPTTKFLPACFAAALKIDNKDKPSSNLEKIKRIASKTISILLFLAQVTHFFCSFNSSDHTFTLCIDICRSKNLLPLTLNLTVTLNISTNQMASF